METWIGQNSAFSAKGFRGHRLLRRQRTANVLGCEFIKFWGVVISVVLSLGKAVEKKMICSCFAMIGFCYFETL